MIIRKKVFCLLLGFGLALLIFCSKDIPTKPTTKPTKENLYPLPQFTVVPSSGTTLTDFQVDASGSSDTETKAESLKVRWDWETDGRWDTDYSNIKFSTHKYTIEGIYTISVQVRDSGGFVSSTSKLINVMSPIPIAKFIVSASSGTTLTVFKFDASGCSDSEDPTSALQVRWDWESDGVWDTDFSTTKTTTHQFASGGNKCVRLEVKDKSGFASYTAAVISVSNIEMGTVVDIDGNRYNTVKNGNQWWMAENLKVTKYRNGDSIPNIASNSEWSNLSTGAYCNYLNDTNDASTYGRLYNGYAINDSRNIAPAGWHVPNYSDWAALINYLGGDTVAGDKMKEIGDVHWKSPNSHANNESGFSALPGGYRDYGGDYRSIRDEAYFWDSSQYDSGTGRYWYLRYDGAEVDLLHYSKRGGFSVRCVKD